ADDVFVGDTADGGAGKEDRAAADGGDVGTGGVDIVASDVGAVGILGGGVVGVLIELGGVLEAAGAGGPGGAIGGEPGVLDTNGVIVGEVSAAADLESSGAV